MAVDIILRNVRLKVEKEQQALLAIRLLLHHGLTRRCWPCANSRFATASLAGVIHQNRSAADDHPIHRIVRRASAVEVFLDPLNDARFSIRAMTCMRAPRRGHSSGSIYSALSNQIWPIYPFCWAAGSVVNSRNEVLVNACRSRTLLFGPASFTTDAGRWRLGKNAEKGRRFPGKCDCPTGGFRTKTQGHSLNA